MRVGTFDPELGGLSVDSITAVLQSGRILIPHMAIIPTAVVANSDRPPEIEVQFNFSRDSYNSNFLEWPNWQLQFVHNQLFEYFKVSSTC